MQNVVFKCIYELKQVPIFLMTFTFRFEHIKIQDRFYRLVGLDAGSVKVKHF